MFLLRRLALWRRACCLLVLAYCGSRLAARETLPAGRTDDAQLAAALHDTIKAEEDLLKASERVVRSCEEEKTLVQTLFETAQKLRNTAKASLDVARQNNPPDSEIVESAEDIATVAEAVERATKKKLDAVSAHLEAQSLNRDEIAAQLTATRAHLKSVEQPAAEAEAELQAANQQVAVARLKAARAAQKAAELKSEVADAERAVAQTELAIAKRRVEKAKKALDEISGQEVRPA
jgi:chromosome segregation ATPase